MMEPDKPVITGLQCLVLRMEYILSGTHQSFERHDCIRESVDSLSRNDADMPMPPYIRKACNCPNAAFVSLFR